MKVRIGIGAAPFEKVENFWNWVRFCEESAIDSIWCSDRIVSKDPTLEPMTTIASLCGATQRLKFGFNAMTIPFRNPVVLAKQCANLDYLSGGRLLPVFGIGQAGKSQDIMSPGGRGARTNEALEIMTRLWTGESVTYKGKYYSVTDARINPLPPQQPFPAWVGGNSPAALKRTARFGTGWIGGLNSPEEVAVAIAGIKRELENLDRSIDEDHYGATILYRFEAKSKRKSSPDDPTGPLAREGGEKLAQIACIGDADVILGKIKEFREGGATKFVAVPIARGDEDYLEQTSWLADELVREVHKLS